MLNPSNAFESEFLEIEKFKSIKDYFKNLDVGVSSFFRPPSAP